MFCGGSLIANKGFRLGNTIDANCVGVSICEMENTLGNMYGRRCVSFISSKREGRIFLVLRPSENLSRTETSPFMKDIFSSLDFVAKLERSRKLSVEIGSDEKKACEGSVDGFGRLPWCRVTRVFSRAGNKFSKREVKVFWGTYIVGPGPDAPSLATVSQHCRVNHRDSHDS